MKLNRENKILAGLVVAALILIGKLFVIQIVDSSYKIDASNNSMVYSTIYPTRGIIYDRNGRILVGNKVAYDILVTPKEVTEFDTLALSEALGVTPGFIKEKMDGYYRNRRRIGYQSVVMLKQLPPERYMRFAELAYKFPGFRGQPRSIRQYPYNAGGNLLGYVSEVDSRYIETHGGEYKAGDYAGMTGIEATCEKYLKGEKGYRIFLRDSRNRIESSYRDGEMDKEAIPGKDIVTTIDAELQNYGQTLMQNKVGSLVAIEPSTGEILALVSSPGIDVDVLADIGSHYTEIASDPYKPMFNRAVQASYPPGSVFKLVNALIGLQEGVVTPQTEYPCHRGYRYGNRKMACHDHRSPIDMKESIMMSCNAYYCYVFRSILEDSGNGTVPQALAKWDEYVASFGFGHKLGSDFPAELGGNIPGPKLYDKMYGKGRWKSTNIISLSIGQGEIGCTPLHLANLCATMANRGYYYIPHIIKESGSVGIDPKYKERQYTMVDTSYFSTLVEGMYMAVNSGYGSGATASVAEVEGLDICGKTGTAQNPHGDDNSVFICFAPKDNPKIAVAAYIEHGSFGARWAAPIASLLTEKYLTGEIRESRKPLEKRMMEGRLLEKVNDRQF
ncbi:MAG: penicillin-binding protein 2 [Bacteroidetes bacterium]|uniref:Penicillin-binding protein 2 n=1 Tax=Candidatus Cryptobacteroides excrementipullorum TaxID=2840761 RepID=A0A9D9IUK0_9BACT|nr:penicillin-binding protein 2 [Candidatus Cryptobacteroides excrementipullorum]